jgi:hypothetical protein
MINEALTEIKCNISWYNKNGKNIQDVNKLLECKDNLAIYSFYLAEYAADKKIDYNKFMFIRKISIARQKESMTDNKMTSTKADNKAIIASEQDYHRELESQGEAYKADLLLKQVNKIIDAIMQRISYLKQELDYTRQQKLT